MTRNPFTRDGAGYRRFRPDYPGSLLQALADRCQGLEVAVDVGCGTGQLAVRLAEHFRRVVAVDPSEEQLKHARSHERVEYRRAGAESLTAAVASADLVAAAQAAHWFDLERFYGQVRRILRPGGLIALISYGVPRIEGLFSMRFDEFYRSGIHEFWPPERRHVEDGYRSLEFPFAELDVSAEPISVRWTADELIGYVRTWSAARRAAAAGREDILRTFETEARRFAAATDEGFHVVWPLNVRVGRTDSVAR